MASFCLQEFPRASGSGDDGGPARKEPESFCCQLATSTPITRPEEFAKLLDLIVHQSKENDPAAGIVFAFLNLSKSNCLFPLACLVHFFEAFVPQPIITYLTSDSCLSATKSIDTILMEAEKSEQGLYKDAKRSCFPSTGRNHFLRLMNASGPAPKREKSAAGAICRGLPELDYILFQGDLPSYFDRSKRYDSLPGDPVNYLFSALPHIQEDDAGFKGSKKSADYNRRLALALWPYANSSIEDIVAKSEDKAASDLWWAARFAFSLWDKSDLSIRCSFTQLLGEIALYHNSEIVDNPAPVKPNHLCEADDGGPCPGEAYVQKHKWLKYARWIHRGRKDEDADIKVRLGSKCDLNELLSIEKCVTCGHERQVSRCGAKKPMHHCSGCYVEWFPHLRRTYCGPKCQKKDWKTHFEECQRHNHFIRAVWILKGIADKFMAATFSGQAVDISPIEVRDNKTKALDLNGVPRFAVTPAACAVGPWVGEQVFPLGKSYLADKTNEDRARALAWDAGDNLYYHLQTIIRQIVTPLCDDVVEMQMFLRNANSITSLAADRCREGPAIHTAKGKDPMFWPHPVLNCRLKGSDDLFIIDLLGAKFGFNEILLPGEVWVKSRLAYCVGSTVVTDMTPHWFPREQQGLVSCRDEVAYTWRSCIKTYIAAKWPNVPGPFALSHLKEQLFRERTYMFMVHSDDIFREVTNRLREERLFRQYLVHDPNPYSHEFSIGVTNCQKECDVYEKIWMDRRVFDVIVKGELSEQNQLLPAGSETIRLVALWVDRLIKHGQKVKFDSVGLLGPRMAKHYNICTTHSLDELREISTPWLLWHGISKDSSQKFFEQCKGIVTDYINSNAATPDQLLSKMASSDGLAKYLQTLSMEDAQEFLKIGSMIESPHNGASIKQLRKELAEQARDKKYGIAENGPWEARFRQEGNGLFVTLQNTLELGKWNIEELIWRFPSISEELMRGAPHHASRTDISCSSDTMPPRLPQQAARALRRLVTTSTPITRSFTTTTSFLAAPAAASLRLPVDYVPATKPPSARPPETRKSQLIRTYTSLLRTTPLILFFQHSNLTADEWSAVRRELNSALVAATPAGTNSPLDGREVHLQVLRTRMFNVALKLAEFYDPEVAKAKAGTRTGPRGPLVHDLSMAAYEAMKDFEVPEDSAYAQISPLLCGPTAALVFPAVSPAHLAAALKILAPGPGKFAAPPRKKNPGYYEPLCQSALQKLLLVGGRVEGDVFDVDGVKWVGGIEGGLDGLRAQLVHMLQSAGLGLTTALEGGSKSVWLALEGRRTQLEDEGKPKESASAEETKSE